MTERSRRRQVKTTLANQGPDFYKEIGSIGGQKSTTKFDSDTGRKAADARWQKVREERLKQTRKESDNDGHQVQQAKDQ